MIWRAAPPPPVESPLAHKEQRGGLGEGVDQKNAVGGGSTPMWTAVARANNAAADADAKTFGHPTVPDELRKEVRGDGQGEGLSTQGQPIVWVPARILRGPDYGLPISAPRKKRADLVGLSIVVWCWGWEKSAARAAQRGLAAPGPARVVCYDRRRVEVHVQSISRILDPGGVTGFPVAPPWLGKQSQLQTCGHAFIQLQTAEMREAVIFVFLRPEVSRAIRHRFRQKLARSSGA